MSHIPCQCSSHTCQESVCQPVSACVKQNKTDTSLKTHISQEFPNTVQYNSNTCSVQGFLAFFFSQAIRSGLVKPVKSQELWRSREANISISLAVRSGDSFELKFSLRRRVEVVLATGVRPRCKCHLRTTCAGDRPFKPATWASQDRSLLFEQFLIYDWTILKALPVKKYKWYV